MPTDIIAQRRPEQFLRNAAIEYAKAGMPNEALDAMGKLEGLAYREFPTAHHLIGLTRVDRSAAGDVYREYAEAWLQKHPDAEMAATLAYELGVQYRGNDNREKTIASFERFATYVQGGRLKGLKPFQVRVSHEYLIRVYPAMGREREADALRAQMNEFLAKNDTKEQD